MVNFVFCFDRIDNITLIADEYLGNEIFDRVKLLLPQSICGCQLAGINARYRFFRYFAGILFFFSFFLFFLTLTLYNIYTHVYLFICLIVSVIQTLYIDRILMEHGREVESIVQEV